MVICEFSLFSSTNPGLSLNLWDVEIHIFQALRVRKVFEEREGEKLLPVNKQLTEGHWFLMELCCLAMIPGKLSSTVLDWVSSWLNRLRRKLHIFDIMGLNPALLPVIPSLYFIFPMSFHCILSKTADIP